MLITTTNTLEGQRIVNYAGIVTGEAILGAHFFKDIMGGIRDIIGGRAGSYEDSLKEARDIALKEMQDEAVKRGANAIIGVDLDYEVIGEKGSMMMVSASGTAVLVE